MAKFKNGKHGADVESDGGVYVCVCVCLGGGEVMGRHIIRQGGC